MRVSLISTRSDDFDNIVETAMISVAGTTGDDPATVSASDISVEAEPGHCRSAGTITGPMTSGAGRPDSFTDVTFDLMQFVGTAW